MATRRRTQFPGVDPQAVRELIGIQTDLTADTGAVRAEAVGRTTGVKVSAYHAGYNERIPVRMPAAGGSLSFPPSSPQAQNRWIEVLVQGGGPVTLRATAGQIQGASSLVLSTPGRYRFVADAGGGWWMPPAGGGGGGGGDPLATVLVTGNTSGGTDISMTAGDAVVFAGGAPGGDVRSTGGLEINAGPGDLHLHAAGAVHVGHTGSTNLIHLEADGEIAATAGANIAAVATTDIALQAGTQLSIATNSVARLTIESDGSWNIGGTNGSAGQVLTSNGAAAAPTWQAAGAGSFSLLTTEVNLGTGGVSGSFTIAGAGMTPGRPVLCVQAVGPYTNKGSLEDVAEEPVWCTAVVTSAVLITVYWQSSRPVGGNVKFNYAVG